MNSERMSQRLERELHACVAYHHGQRTDRQRRLERVLTYLDDRIRREKSR